MKFVTVLIFASTLVTATFAPTGFASAQIVALGASNTQGYGVNPSEAWPAQLESMLRAKGSSAHITNAGVFGETTGQELARLSSAVPDGTKVVILGIGTFNDARTGGSIDVARANIDAIKNTTKGSWHQGSRCDRDHDVGWASARHVTGRLCSSHRRGASQGRNAIDWRLQIDNEYPGRSLLVYVCGPDSDISRSARNTLP
jgi:acyl-CoA thioesterase-1